MTLKWLYVDFWLSSGWFKYNFIMKLKTLKFNSDSRQDIHWEKGWEMLCVCWVRLPSNDFEMSFGWHQDDFMRTLLFSLKLYIQTQTRRQDIHWEKGWEMLCLCWIRPLPEPTGVNHGSLLQFSLPFANISMRSWHSVPKLKNSIWVLLGKNKPKCSLNLSHIMDRS